MTNQEKQADEILVLQSIFDKKFRFLDDNQYEILIDFEFLSPITIKYNNQISTIQYLPPFTLIIHYHDEYPSDESPSFILSCFYFSKNHLENLCKKLDNYLFENDVCVYDWINIIKNEINNQLIFNQNFQEEKMNDPRALNGYTNENIENIFQYLINYNQEYQIKQFQNHLQTCFICTDIIPGSECICLHRCGHYYCQNCLKNYVQITLNDGQFGEKIHCPQIQCKQALLPTEIKQSLQNDQLYERYERLTLQHGLELMNDIVWCPRCEHPVLIDNGNDNLAMCDRCRYTFCKKCKEIFHSQTMCPKDYLIEQIKLQQEKERQRIQKQKEEALAQIAKIEQEKKSLAERKLAKERYRQIVIKLSDEDALLEQLLNAERIQSLNTQRCPRCHVRIEKNGGCSHMHCSRCDHHFIWQTIPQTRTDNSVSLLTNMPVESIREELNKSANIVKTIEKETDQVAAEEDDQDELDLKISIDNRSTIGSAIIKRVKQCPTKLCKKLNVKIDQDNWMVCNECMKQYCFLCGGGVNGIRHFEKKCQRYTPIE